MKDVDDYRWILLDDREAGEAAFTCESDFAEASGARYADQVDAHFRWRWLSAIDERSAGRTCGPGLPVIQID